MYLDTLPVDKSGTTVRIMLNIKVIILFFIFLWFTPSILTFEMSQNAANTQLGADLLVLTILGIKYLKLKIFFNKKKVKLPVKLVKHNMACQIRFIGLIRS